ncbi:hypothetical protein DV735_g9, partial [Chaetothyriales sp. CBS 134920]
MSLVGGMFTVRNGHLERARPFSPVLLPVPSVEADLFPRSDSESLTLEPATPEEWQQSRQLHAEEWKGPLSIKQYLGREKVIFSQELTKDGKSTCWILTSTQLPPNPDGTRLILASCETISVKASIARDGELHRTTCAAIGSVFTRMEHRGRGYAGRMMVELGKKVETWQQPNGDRSQFSVLYSDIGKTFYSQFGWKAFPSTHIHLPPIDQQIHQQMAQKLTAVHDVYDLTADDLKDVPAVKFVEQNLLRESSQTPNTTFVAIDPDLAHFRWHHAREEFVFSALGKKEPLIKGATHLPTGIAVVWTRVLSKDPNDWKLYVLHIIIPPGSDWTSQGQEALSALLLRAQLEATTWDLQGGVEIWDPKDTIVSAAQNLRTEDHDKVEVVERDEDHIPSLRWTGAGGEDTDVVWLYNQNDDNTDQGSKPEDEKEPSGGIGHYMRIFQYADGLSITLFVLAVIGSIAAGTAPPLMSLIFGKFTDQFNDFSVGASDRESFIRTVNDLVLWFVYLFIARFVILYAANVGISIAAIRTTAAIRRAFLEATLRQEVWHFDKLSNGSAATQLTTNGNRINQGLADKLANFAQGLGLFFSGFIVALSAQWKLSLIVMTVVPAMFLVSGSAVAFDAVLETKIIRLYSRAAVVAQEALSSIKTVHAFWAQGKLANKYNGFLLDAQKEGKKKSVLYGILFSADYFLVMSGIALAFWKGFRMFQGGEIKSVGTVFTVVLSITLGATAMAIIVPQLQSITNASAAAAELFAIIDKESKLDPLSPDGKQPSNCRGNIQVRNLCFAYPSRPQAQVLHSLNLSIPASKTTALVGASGCGKSTLVGLLERWYVPTSGEILLDGVDLSEYNTAWLRRQIRLVQQEPVLFRGTVFENVARGFVGSQTSLAQEEQMKLVEEACKSANAHDFIVDLPHGYHTQVGERASMLSGGQKQRIAIARSIISDPKILLLDEATSALDPRAEKVVQDALNRVSANKTTLIIAHKLATVRKADNIVVMSHGKVVEEGTHNELLERDGQYAALVRAQDLGSKHAEPSFIKEQEDVGLERSATLQREKSEPLSLGHDDDGDEEEQKLARGTLNLSLVRCIWTVLSEQRDLYGWFSLIFFGCLIGGGSYPAQAIVFSRLTVVFTLQGREARDEADFFSLMLFVLALANLVGYFAIGWSCNEVSQAVTTRYRLEMFERILGMDAVFFDRPENSSGALTSKLSSLPTALQELISTNIGLIFIVLVNLVSSSVVAIAYGWKLGLVVVFGGLPVLVGAGFVRIRLEQKSEQEVGKPFSDSAALATEAVTSIRTISSLTLEGRIMDEYNATLQGIVGRTCRSLFITMFWYAVSQSVDFLIMALGFWYGSRLLASGEYTTPQFFVIYISVIFGGQGAGQFFSYTTSITKAKVAANYIFWLRTLKAKIVETEENKDKRPPLSEGGKDGALAVEEVEFRYAQRDTARVLRGISMNIAPGSYAACVGPSGCGKSTLISLLERFYDPTSGRITINKADIASLSPRNWRVYMSLVQQEPTLYQGSIRENITLGLDYDASEEEIHEACRQANALEFIQSLPDGLATECGSKGLQFSGGQRQRIAIARALIRKPRLLLLDEATSALDTQSERIVQQALDEAASLRTTVAVAHRLSTIRHADIIFVFAGGKIAEMGTHEELLALGGRYFDMATAQSLDRA